MKHFVGDYFTLFKLSLKKYLRGGTTDNRNAFMAIPPHKDLKMTLFAHEASFKW